MNTEQFQTRRDLLAALATFGVVAGARAQDAVTADPRSFRVVLDNERVRVLEFRSGPGLSVCGQGMHYHPERVTVSLTGGKVKVTNADGKAVVREIAPGQAWFAPAETHATENVGGAGTRTYIIELKGPDWKPSSG